MNNILDDSRIKNDLSMLTEAGHKILLQTWLFRKKYFWMSDPFGTIYLQRAPMGMELDE